MSFRALSFCLLLFGFTGIGFGQHAVDPSQRYHRLICLVHLTGSGKKGDPILPEYVPVSVGPTTGNSSTAAAGSSTAVGAPLTGIAAWAMQITDDGKMAIIHMVAVNRNSFAAVFADTRPEIKVFEIGVDKQATIEAFMQQHKKGFTLNSIQVVAQ
jgi:hypothetical protein